MINQVESDHDDGYNAEEEDDSVKTSEEKLVEITAKYSRLKCKHFETLEELNDLKEKLDNCKSDMVDVAINSYEENKLVELKAKGFRKTSPQSQAETNLKCEVCNTIFNSDFILKKHILNHNTEGDWTGGDQECWYQTNTKANLDKHKRAAHFTSH